MSVHYHGLPLTPLSKLDRLAGKHVCVSFATKRDTQVEWAKVHAQSIMLDNGAFSAFTKGVPFDERGFYEWIDPLLHHPNWAVIPDVIDGSVEQQKDLVARWPFDRMRGMPVWHLGLPISYLLDLANSWPRICFGSSGQYWKIGSETWMRRMDDAFNALEKHFARVPWVHGLRMLDWLGRCWPLASADSVNVARNYHRYDECPGCMSHRIDTGGNTLTDIRHQELFLEIL